ncbi:hypothetical protein QYE76_000072 [Lolium multiflorum]|uniref:SUI1 domain-containing protein n=1 Tax=Lolium multiflorum TaxID=4521 RepID=A0AAD8V9X7_LOLMU|nr:hypothetical protein QYE76_000072 [Lolium multiflorum]
MTGRERGEPVGAKFRPLATCHDRHHLRPYIPLDGRDRSGDPTSVRPGTSTLPTRAVPPCSARTPLDRFPPINTSRGLSQKHIQKSTNANPPAISSARASRANTPAATVSSPSASPTNTADVAPPEFEPKVSPPPPFASDRWAAGGASSSDEEEDVKKTTTKKGTAAVKRAPAKKSSKPKGKDKYLAEAPPSEQEFMSGTPDFDDDALPPTSFDPFADEAADAGAGAAGAGDDGRVHLRVQQRNGRKTLTTRELCCNGTVVEDKELGNVIQLQGDHRKKVAAFIAKAGLAKTDCIKVHGF